MSAVFDPLSGFSGTARLFPLPNLVFFPQVMQPLHIFEPRYCRMTADALAGDRLIALVLPRHAPEAEPEEAPALNAVACLGKIVADQALENGRYNILLRGLSRLRIVHEIPLAKPYRKARTELLNDLPVVDQKKARRLRRKLIANIPGWFTGQSAILEQLRKLFRIRMTLGSLCDIIAFALPVEAEFKQSLLEELDVERRVTGLMSHLAKRAPATAVERKFPPEFSHN